MTVSSMLGDMLDLLLHDLAHGEVSPVSMNDPANTHFNTGPWRGLKDVTVRYDCVTFHSGEKPIEARISRLPVKQADQVREVWLCVNPDYADMGTLWRAVVLKP